MSSAAAASPLVTYSRMIKLSHSIFALPFALAAAVLAASLVTPTWWQLVLIVLCMITARSSAMGFNRIVDIWGADHHGYIPRVRGAIEALGLESAKFEVALVQFAVLYRNGQKAAMSTRSGEFVTLRELRQDVGNDACRFFYVLRKSDQHLDFDLDLAKSQTNENPVYYVKYAHARICSVLQQAADQGIGH